MYGISIDQKSDCEENKIEYVVGSGMKSRLAWNTPSCKEYKSLVTHAGVLMMLPTGLDQVPEALMRTSPSLVHTKSTYICMLES